MASGFSVASNEHLIRTLWSRQLKELLLDDLYAMQWVRILNDFPDGDLINIPSVGEAEVSNYVEGQAIKYNRMDTGNFQFQWDRYQYSANSITEQFRQDSWYASEVEGMFVPREHRALMQNVEARIFEVANEGQAASDLNAINGANHRWVASGTNESISQADFLKAQHALVKANVPLTNLVAVVDPSVAFTLQNQANAVNLLSPMPQWADVNKNGLVSGYRFRFNFAGFDVYQSNYLPQVGAETIDGRSTTTGVANLFFSAAPGDTLPIIGGFKQMPTVYHEFNKDLQQDEYLTICRYGFKLYRPENMVVVLSDTDVVA